MQDKTYDTGDNPDPRLTCAKVHYSHCQDKGHIDFCYKLERTAPAYMECQVWGGLKGNLSDVSGHTRRRIKVSTSRSHLWLAHLIIALKEKSKLSSSHNGDALVGFLLPLLPNLVVVIKITDKGGITAKVGVYYCYCLYLMSKFQGLDYSAAGEKKVHLHIHLRHDSLLTKNTLLETTVSTRADFCSEIQREMTWKEISKWMQCLIRRVLFDRSQLESICNLKQSA